MGTDTNIGKEAISQKITEATRSWKGQGRDLSLELLDEVQLCQSLNFELWHPELYL